MTTLLLAGPASLSTSLSRSLTTSLADVLANLVLAGHTRYEGLAQNADILPITIGRQADQIEGAPQALDLATAVLTSAVFWWVTTGIAALWIAVLVLLRHFRSHHLRSHVAYDLLPTTTFDAAPQAVVNFAHQLGRTRPVRGWLPKSVMAVRVCFRTDEQAKLIMGLRGRQSIRGVLNMQPYAQVELRRRRDGDLSPPAPGGALTSIASGGETSPNAGGGEVTPTPRQGDVAVPSTGEDATDGRRS